jgi:hypothetical protein
MDTEHARDTRQSRIASAFGLEGDAWLRHANPWSVYTRIPIPCALALAVWSRDWIGWWSLLPIALVVVWTVVNPSAFPPPRSLDHWASKAVLGETIWTKRASVPIPRTHQRAPIVLTVISTLGLPVLVWGLVVLDFWMVLTGLAVQMAGKTWFLDRMVWLYEDMQRQPGGQAVPQTTERGESSVP